MCIHSIAYINALSAAEYLQCLYRLQWCVCVCGVSGADNVGNVVVCHDLMLIQVFVSFYQLVKDHQLQLPPLLYVISLVL